MKQCPLYFPFLLGLLSALFGTAFFPYFHLIAFAPFLAIAYNRTSIISCLWLAVLCGVIIDLLSSQLRFGLHTLNYSLVTVLLYKQRHHFFEDKSLSLSIFTALISSLSTLLQLLLLYAFDKTLPFTWKLVITDLIGMPLVDALYAYIWFTCSIKAFLYVKKVGVVPLLKKCIRSIRFSRTEGS